MRAVLDEVVSNNKEEMTRENMWWYGRRFYDGWPELVSPN